MKIDLNLLVTFNTSFDWGACSHWCAWKLWEHKWVSWETFRKTQKVESIVLVYRTKYQFYLQQRAWTYLLKDFHPVSVWSSKGRWSPTDWPGSSLSASSRYLRALNEPSAAGLAEFSSHPASATTTSACA